MTSDGGDNISVADVKSIGEEHGSSNGIHSGWVNSQKIDEQIKGIAVRPFG